MKPKLTERSERKFVAEYDPPPLFVGRVDIKILGVKAMITVDFAFERFIKKWWGVQFAQQLMER